MYRCVVLAVLALLIGRCDFGDDTQRVKEDTPNGKGQKTDKVAELSFADDDKLQVEVGEYFNITVKVENIEPDNLADDLDWTDHQGNPMKREGEPDWDSLRVTSKLMVKGKVSAILNRGYSDTRLKTKGGVIEIKGFHFTETCEADCHIVFGLEISGICVGDSGCESAQVEPVDEISKAVVVTPDSYTAKIEKLDEQRNIKLTITKDGAPLANGRVEVRADIACLVEEPVVWGGADCKIPADALLPSREVTLDANGSWNIKLDADGSWEKEVSAAYQAETGKDYTLNVCDVSFNISIDGRAAYHLKPTGVGC